MPRALAVVALAGLPLSASAQVACNQPVGPDVLVSDITGVANYAATNGRDAFSFGNKQTDAGSLWIEYISSISRPAAHPVTVQNLFRLSTVNGAPRFEQIGQSWAFHGLCALAMNNPCATCTAPPDCSHLGVGCSSPDTAASTGTQSGLSPRWQINPSTGAFVYPPANPSYSGPIARRLQAAASDLNTTDQFFVETLVIAPDDAAAGNGANNATYRPVTFSGGPTEFAIATTGVATPGRPAIRAWHDGDLTVDEQIVGTGDGRLILSSRVTALGGGLWRYEYAIYNQNSDSGVGAFTVPVPVSATVLNPGFHSVAYTDGDGIASVTRDGAPWDFAHAGGTASWSTTPSAADPNANALLWGTLFNFRFDCDLPPGHTNAPPVSVTLWKSPATTLSAGAFTPTDCYANCDNSTITPRLNVLDFACFLELVAAGDPAANCDGSTTPPLVNVLDFTCFLNKFAAGCS